MHPLVEKITIIAKKYSGNILKLLHQIHAVSAPVAKKTLVTPGLALKKAIFFANRCANRSLIVIRCIYIYLAVLAKKTGTILISISTRTLDFIKSHWPSGKKKIIQYYYLARLDKPVGILLLLWPVLWALWIAAEGSPDFDVLFIFILGVIVMRSAGCIINDLADRNLDRHISRTSERPITSGKVKSLEAIQLTIVLMSCALLLVFNLNSLTFKLSFVAALLAVIYPFMKRITYLPQVFLGLTFAWSIPMAFAAQTNTIPEIAWLIFITTVLWAVVYDTMYAMVDREDDIKTGIKSTAILFDDADRVIIGAIQLMVLFSQLLTGAKLELGRYYYIGIAIASLLSIYQQYLIKDRIPENCFRAFLNHQWYGMAVFVGLYLNYMLG